MFARRFLTVLALGSATVACAYKAEPAVDSGLSGGKQGSALSESEQAEL